MGTMRMDVRPVTLEGQAVRIELLGLEHAENLYAAAQDPDIWRYMPADPSGSREAFRRWIEEALAARTAGAEMPFAIVDKESGRAVGSTRYLDIHPRDFGLEIGWTWLARPVRRTRVNTECKYLLLQHAFETLGAVRVQLKTDVRNEVSQRAIARLGAVREGVLRKQRILENGYVRDTVLFSIIAEEWPAVKAGLEAKLEAR
jgi:N-acetyltransferase